MTDGYYVIPFGRYKGEKTVEQVALLDYSSFDWFLRNDSRLSPQFRRRNRGVEHALNHLAPEEYCKGRQQNGSDVYCSQPAEWMSIVYDNSGISAERNFVYCGQHKNQGAAYNPKARPFPIEFRTILSFPVVHDREHISELLRELAGFHGDVRREGAKEFIDRLLLKSHYQPPRELEPVIKIKPKPSQLTLL